MLRLLRQRRKQNKPQLPDRTRIYAFGDIHGRGDLLQNMFAVIDADLTRNPVARPIEVFLGDYVDRGPNSAKVLDLLIDRGRQRETVFLKGNHEAFFLEVMSDPTKLDQWRQIGGLETLMSYGLQPSINSDVAEQARLIGELRAVLPEQHFSFLNGLMLYFVCGDFLFVHAGVRFGISLDEQREADLLWIRNEFLDRDENFGKFIVHGHTPVREPDLRRYRINIDTGAYATGNLTLLRIEGSSVQPI
jgi:serine/threonine protein phosphatase 1